MKEQINYPLIAEVKAEPDKRLRVRFRNGVTKVYDCKKILALPAFASLRHDEALFRRARADKHGYGVVWSAELDLAESEVWLGGRIVREKPEAYGSSTAQQTAKATAVKRRKSRDRITEDRKSP